MTDYYLEDLKRNDEPPDPWYVHLAKVLIGVGALFVAMAIMAQVIQP